MSSSLTVRTLAATPRIAIHARRPQAAASRSFSAAAVSEVSASAPPPPPITSSISRPAAAEAQNETTAQQAQAYLSDLLSLPPSAAFPPELALQILTHKSYRFVHRLAHPPPYTAAEVAQSQASHNARLAFVGRRALAAYAAMFIHSALPSQTSSAVHSVDFLRGRSLEEKLDALRHANNLGRAVGEPWGVGEVMRWDRQPTGREGGYAKIKGLTVEAILGGVFTHLGSPSAQRTFHLHVLPHLAPQLRDPALIEAAARVRESAERVGTVA